MKAPNTTTTTVTAATKTTTTMTTNLCCQCRSKHQAPPDQQCQPLCHLLGSPSWFSANDASQAHKCSKQQQQQQQLLLRLLEQQCQPLCRTVMLGFVQWSKDRSLMPPYHWCHTRGESRGSNCPPKIFVCHKIVEFQVILFFKKKFGPKMPNLGEKHPTLEKFKGESGDGYIAPYGKPISELRSVTCHIQCYLPANTGWTRPALTKARQTGTQFTYPGGMEGWVDLGSWLHTKMVYLSPITNPRH